MAYDPTLPGFEEARLDAYQAFMQSKLSDLNTALARSGFNSTHGLATITNSMIVQGNTATMFDLDDAPMQFRLTNGDDLQGDDFEAHLFQSVGVNHNSGWFYDFVTHLYVYIHPDLFYNEDAQAQEADRQRCLNRVADWLVGEFNYWDPTTLTGGTVVPLTSSIIGQPYDKLMESTLVRLTRDFGIKSFGTSQAFPTLYARIESKLG